MAINGKDRYRTVKVKLHREPRFRALSRPQPNAQSLYLYLKTGPHTTNVPGVFCLSEAGLAEDLGWSIDGLRGAFSELEAAGFAQADWSTRLVWLPDNLIEDHPDNPSVVLSWRTVWGELPTCALLAQITQAFANVLSARTKPFMKAFDSFAGHGVGDLRNTVSVTVGVHGVPHPETESEPELRKDKTVLCSVAARVGTISLGQKKESASSSNINADGQNNYSLAPTPNPKESAPAAPAPCGTVEDLFVMFWARWPNKVHRKQALKVFCGMGAGMDYLNRILAVLAEDMRHGWLKENQTPEKWLRDFADSKRSMNDFTTAFEVVMPRAVR